MSCSHILKQELAACPLYSTWCKAHGYSHGVSGRLVCGLGSKEHCSLSFLVGALLFGYKEEPNAACCSLPTLWGGVRRSHGGEGKGSNMPSTSGSPVTQDGAQGWLCRTGHQAASLWLPARSQVLVPLEAWGDSRCSGDSNTVAMNQGVNFPEKKLAH